MDSLTTLEILQNRAELLEELWESYPICYIREMKEKNACEICRLRRWFVISNERKICSVCFVRMYYHES